MGAGLSSPIADAKSTANFDILASAPPSLTGTVTPALYWRETGMDDGTGYDARKGGTDGWTKALDYPAVSAGTTPLVDSTWNATDVAIGLGRERTMALLDLQVCFSYESTGDVWCTWNDDEGSHRTIVRVPHAFGNNFPVASAGPGQVAMWTGEFNTAVTDLEVPGYTGTLSVSRYYNTFSGGTGDGVFGPGWVPSFEGSDIGAAGLTVVDMTAEYGVIGLEDLDGSSLLFREPSETQTPQEIGVYTPFDDETAETGAILELFDDSGTLKLALREETETTTVWERLSSGEWVQIEVIEPGNAGKTTYSHDSQGRITRILAPVPPGVTCGTTLAPGCRAITVEYATATTATSSSLGDISGQVKSVTYHAYNPDKVGGAGMDSQVITTYVYDDGERLREVTDARNDVKILYEYTGVSDAGVPLLTSVKPGGLAAWRMEYADITTGGAALGTDALVRVSRDPASGTGPAVTMSRYVYGIDITGATGGLPNMGASQVALWGQGRVPTWGAATFGPDKDPGTSDPAAISAADFEYANLSYTDDQGYTVNTAEFGAGQWLLSATEFDSAGRIVSTLDPTSIAALKDLAALNGGNPVGADVIGSYASITRYNTAPVVAASDITLASGTIIAAGAELTPVGTLITDTWAPAVSIDGVGLRRVHTHIDYDQGAPNGGVNPVTGIAFRLPTTSTDYDADGLSGSWQVTYTLPTGEAVLGQSLAGYDPIDGSSITGPTSGWMLGAETVSTTVMENPADNIVSKARYDELGRVVESRGPSSTGTDAGTGLSVFYSAGTNPADAACGNRPEWAGLSCVSRTAEATPTVPSVRVTQYSMLLAPQVTVETLGSVTRTTTTTYLPDGRSDTSSTVVTGLASSQPVPTTKTLYDSTTGLPTATLSLDSQGVEIGRISTVSDLWGRNTSYTDSDGAVTTNSFDTAGRLVGVTDPQKTVTYSFDGVDAFGNRERRSLPTSMTITGVGTFAAAYDTRGDMVYQSMPGGIEQLTTTNRAGEATGLTYRHVDGSTVTSLLAWTQVNDLYGRVVAEVTPSSGHVMANQVTEFSRDYTYDRAGRLTVVHDRTAAAGAVLDVELGDGSGTPCVTRTYAFDVTGNRLSRTSTVGGADGVCTSTGGVIEAWSYDAADRVQTGANATGSYVYDALGRQLSIPAVDTPQGVSAGDVSLTYFDNDLIQSLSQNGSSTSFTLDPAGRRLAATVSGASPRTLVRHYADPSDEPAYVTSTVGGVTSTTWYGSSLGGDLGVTVTDGVTQVTIADLHGDVATTLTLDAAGGVTAVGAFSDYDEYGRLLTQQPNTGAVTYGWVGSHERATDDTGLLLMGVRVYNPVTGLFTSTDPVAGGGDTAYGYPTDPVNKFDLDGRLWGWVKKAVKAVAKAVTKVAEIASYIPGPIGMVASGVAAAGYLAQGDYKAAAAAIVGVIPGGKMMATTAKIAKTVKATTSAKKVTAVVSKVTKACNSFDQGTMVTMADGTEKPIEEVKVGDLVLSTDPATGQLVAEPVTALIRHLEIEKWVAVTISIDGQWSTIDATAGHPWWVVAVVPDGVLAGNEGSWVLSEDLRVGDHLLTPSGVDATVAGLNGYEATAWAYNLTIANTHTYYVGDGPVLVHNAKACSLSEAQGVVSKMNTQILRGQAPRGIIRADKGKIVGELPHVHLAGKRGAGALNFNGTWKHGYAVLNNKQKSWLRGWGWKA